LTNGLCCSAHLAGCAGAYSACDLQIQKPEFIVVILRACNCCLTNQAAEQRPGNPSAPSLLRQGEDTLRERHAMTDTRTESSAALPLLDNGVAVGKQRQNPGRTGWRVVFMVPALMLALFSGAVIGMYFQPPGLRIFFNTTGLEPGAGTDTPIAVAIRQVIAQEQVAVLSEGDLLALGRIIPFGDVTSVATPSGAGDARIAELRVAVGDTVAQDDILAVLDNLAQLQSAVATAQAGVRVREAALA
jgi:HlyD family secretion protein